MQDDIDQNEADSDQADSLTCRMTSIRTMLTANQADSDLQDDAIRMKLTAIKLIQTYKTISTLK